MKGYKAFNKDLVCRGMQYEIGKEYKYDGEPIPCKQGYHFCLTIADCYNYYHISDDTRICEIEAVGDIETDDDVKYCTNHIKIVKEIADGRQRKGNTGNCNTGYCNTGDKNTGDKNTGNKNTGNSNTGSWNTGNHNTGGWNTGNRNTGIYNTGNRNTGNWNTGNWNTGDWNAGDWNTGNWNCGIFNTNKNPTIKIFNKESSWTFNDWRKSVAKRILDMMPMDRIVWIDKNEMTDDEKEQNPSYKCIGGYLKKCEADKTPQEWWDSLHENYKNEVMSLPNFDAEMFYECTGIEV